MERLIQQILRFGVVGVLATLVDYAVLLILSQIFGMNAVLAAGISFCVSVVFNYVASMRFVFTHREDMSASREFVTFIVLSIIGLGLNELIMWIGTRAMGSSALAVTVVKAVATAIVMVWNFVSRKIWLDGGSQA